MPDAFWKVIIREGRVIAWIIPNNAEAKYKVLDQYLAPVRQIEQVTEEKIPLDDFARMRRLQKVSKFRRVVIEDSFCGGFFNKKRKR